LAMTTDRRKYDDRQFGLGWFTRAIIMLIANGFDDEAFLV